PAPGAGRSPPPRGAAPSAAARAAPPTAPRRRARGSSPRRRPPPAAPPPGRRRRSPGRAAWMRSYAAGRVATSPVRRSGAALALGGLAAARALLGGRSEEHTSEL